MTILKSWFHSSNQKKSSSWAHSTQGIDVVLLLVVVSMVLFGLVMVYSSSFIYAQEKTGDGFSFIKKQMVYSALGFLSLWLTSRMDYRKWSHWAYPLLGVAIFFLGLIFIPGVGLKVLGARRWIHLFNLTFQPGEFAKFAIILFVARQLDKKSDRLGSLSAGVFAQFIAPLPAFLLLLMQPDFGTIVMIAIVIFSMMFLAGVPKKYLASAFAIITPIGLWLAIGTRYRRDRILTFIDPWRDPGGKGFQILQSFVGLHHGRIWGVGLGNGKEKLFYLPEAHNDFILSVIGEELGFVGIAAVVVAYLIIIHRGLKIAWNCQNIEHDRFGMLLATGITLALGFQGFVNIAVVLGLLPTKGLTLPFISYGGSALLVDLFAVGILLSIGRRRSFFSSSEKNHYRSF